MATFIENITTPGQGLVSTQNGRIIIDEAQAELVFTQPDGTRKVVHNAQGSSYKDEQGREMTRLDTLGLTTIEPDTGRERNRVGIARSDGRTIIATTKTGVDLRSGGI